MTLATLLTVMKSADIRMEIVEGRLRVNAPRGAVTPVIQSAFVEHKAALVGSVKPPWPPRPPELASWPIGRREAWGRLANQLEDGGLSWNEAEQRAFAQVNAQEV
jgi:hypothetical protein